MYRDMLTYVSGGTLNPTILLLIYLLNASAKPQYSQSVASLLVAG